MIDRLRAFYDHLVLDRPWAVLVFLAAVVAAMVTQAGNFRLTLHPTPCCWRTTRICATTARCWISTAPGLLFVTYNPGAQMLGPAMLEGLEALREDLLAVPAVETWSPSWTCRS